MIPKFLNYIKSKSPAVRVILVSDIFWDLVVMAVPFAVYLRTMSPTIYGLDSAELTTGAYTLGIVHPPGSPLFLLLGRLFTYIPIGDIGFRVNLLSVFSATITVFLLYRILLILTKHRAISISTSWFFAFTYYFWTSALAAELYAMQALFLALSILLAIKFNQTGKKKFLYSLSFFFGLGLGNHLSIILLAPGLAWIVLSQIPTKTSKKYIPACVLFACLGASIYLYLPIRYSAGAALDYAQSYWGIDLTTLDGFLWMISGKMFNSLFWAYSLREIPTEIIKYLYQLWSNFLGLGVIFGVIGIINDFRLRPKFNIGLGIMLIGYLIFYISYGAFDKEVMFLPSYLIWSIWIGLGVWGLQDLLKRKILPSYEMLAANTLLFLAMSSLLFNFSYVDISQDWSARKLGEDILETLKPNSMYFGSWVDVPILEYLQVVEGKRSDIETRNLIFMKQDESTRLAEGYLLTGNAVYTSTSNWFDETKFIYVPVFPCSCYELKLRTRHFQ